MKRVKEKWDTKYLEHQATSWQKLRDNAACFKKEPVIRNLTFPSNRSYSAGGNRKGTADEEGNLSARLGNNENKSST